VKPPPTQKNPNNLNLIFFNQNKTEKKINLKKFQKCQQKNNHLNILFLNDPYPKNKIKIELINLVLLLC